MPAWSPDGATIAFATRHRRSTPTAPRAQDVAQIATVPAAGGAVDDARGDPADAARGPWPATPPGRRTARACCSTCSATAPPTTSRPATSGRSTATGVRAGQVSDSRGDEAQPHAQGPAPPAVSAGAALDLHARDAAAHPRHPHRHRRAAPARSVRAASSTWPSAGWPRRRPPSRPTRRRSSSTSPLTDTTAGHRRDAPTRRGTRRPARQQPQRLRARTTVPNLVTARIGANGAVSLRNGVRLGRT